MRHPVLILAVLSGLVACAPATSDFGGHPAATSRVTELGARERAGRLPNPLFGGVWNASSAEVDQALASDPNLALALNVDGDTPLGLALKEGRPELARRLLRAMSPRALDHRNLAGEGYVFLAARAGYPDLITALAEAHYQTLGALDRYDFSRLDRRTRFGQRALFAAANRAVAETLEAQHYRGVLKYPWRDFMLARDKSGQNFLHAAARDGREDVIFWASERLCPAGRWERSETWYKTWPAWGVTHALGLVQTYVTGDLRLWWDKVINRQDKLGRTPLHVAIENKQWRALRALAHCRWTDFDLVNHHGDLPLHAFLERANPDITSHAPDVYEAFDFLIAQDTRLRLRTLATRLSVKNHDGETALHVAARLADPYFYLRLARVGDVFALNRQNMTAERIFANRQRQVSQNGY